jgi:hypothetical protein
MWQTYSPLTLTFRAVRRTWFAASTSLYLNSYIPEGRNFITTAVRTSNPASFYFVSFLFSVQGSVSHLKITIFRNVTSCSLVGEYQRFGGICYIHLLGIRETLLPWRWIQQVPQKRCCPFIKAHGVTSQMIAILILAACDTLKFHTVTLHGVVKSRLLSGNTCYHSVLNILSAI